MLAASARAAGPAAIDEPALKDFSGSIPIAIQGGESFHAAELPLPVYAGSERRDLGDLRVFNGAGETVPYALVSPPASGSEKSPPAQVPLFPLWAQAGREAGALSVRVEQNDRGAIVTVHGAEKSKQQPRLAGYLVDVSALNKPLQAIDIDWGTGTSESQEFTGQITVEAGDDFAHWTTAAAAAPLLSLQHEGHALTLNRVELPRLAAKYLRLSWPAAQATPKFSKIMVEAVDSAVDAPRTWTSAAGQNDKKGEYGFDLKAHAPFDRLRIELPNPNTVATVQLLARSRIEEPWHAVASPTIYRLTRGGKDFVSPDLAVPIVAERFWLMRLDPRTSIGQGVPRLSAGFVPQTIVFAARGAPPFVLAYGAPTATSAAIPISALVPGYREDRPLDAAAATFGEAQRQATAASRPPSWMDWRAYDWKQIALWSVLVAGVALLGWMALRLGKQIQPPPPG
jgi:hypothetical protein